MKKYLKMKVLYLVLVSAFGQFTDKENGSQFLASHRSKCRYRCSSTKASVSWKNKKKVLAIKFQIAPNFQKSPILEWAIHHQNRSFFLIIFLTFWRNTLTLGFSHSDWESFLVDVFKNTLNCEHSEPVSSYQCAGNRGQKACDYRWVVENASCLCNAKF